MFHFCIMAGHDGELSADQKVCFTLFGGCSLRRPTLAKRIMEARRRQQSGLPRQTHFFVTICGGTELRTPTLAEEYLAMREAVGSGAINLAEWDMLAAQLAANESFTYGSFTLMGGFSGAELPPENEEVEGLAIARHVGNIPETAGKMLELGVGQAGAHRASFIRQAFAATVGGLR